MERIVIVEDDESIRQLIHVALEGFGYEVIEFECAEDALAQLPDLNADLVVFDWMLPGQSGVEAIRTLRSQQMFADLPILLLTAKDKELDKVQGLDQGADDYMTKPFSVLELAARIRNQLRHHKKAELRKQIGELVIQFDTREVMIQGKPIELTYKEFELLKYLIQQAPRVVSRDDLFHTLWGYDYVGESRTLDVHINTLRKKLTPAYGDRIKVVRGVGYRFDDE